MEYDVQQREAIARNPAHDLTTLDLSALTIISTRIALQSAPHTYAPQPTPHTNSPPKRPLAPDTSQQQPRKRTKPDRSLCFRCGLAGHFPADCKADRTTAGKPPATVTSGPKGEHSLTASSGKQYCFNWARSTACKWGDNCYNTHGCSLCHDTTHGAATCSSLR